MSEMALKDRGQKSAEAEVEKFRQELGPFVVAADATRMPMVFTDAQKPDNPIIFANESFLTLIGYGREEVLARSLNFILGLGADERAVREVEAAFVDPPQEDPEIHYKRKDGSMCWATLFVAPVTDEQGAVLQNFVSLIDVTHFKMAEENTARLVDELKHRVKNTLAIVQSIVSQAVRSSQDSFVVRELIETRIGSLSRAHDLLGREEWKGVGLNDLVCEVLEPFRACGGRARRFTIEGENIRLLPNATLGLGIAFHELATNAIKYGAFSNETGKISIKWTRENKPDGRWLCVHWRETGGPPVTVPKRRGFGSRVIEQGLAHDVEGKVELNFLPPGVVCTIDIPDPHAIDNE